MNILIILDPVRRLNPKWDNSLAVGKELIQRGHIVWTADIPDLRPKGKHLFVSARKLEVSSSALPKPRFKTGCPEILDAYGFDLILVRKEPPVNQAFLKMTRLLDPVSKKVPTVNRPSGIRTQNEKLSILNFPKWIPPTLVSSSVPEIIRFQKKHGEIVVKPLDQKGGKGVFLLSSTRELPQLRRLLKKSRPIMAQKRLLLKGSGEKRIVVIEGRFFCAYRKKPVGKEWRGNLDLGAEFVHCGLSRDEKQMLREMRAFLLKNGLYFAGLDTINGKLIEINVTCPAGVTESESLNPRARLVSAWADFLERFAAS